METYLGHTAKYWLELEKRAEELGVINYLEEIAELRGKLSFVEDRLAQIKKVLEH